MRPKVIAGNWKMHHGPAATRKFFSDFSPRLSGAEPMILIFPPVISLVTAAESRGGVRRSASESRISTGSPRERSRESTRREWRWRPVPASL